MTGPTFRWDIVQGTPEWHAARAGKWSASKAAITMGDLQTSGLLAYIKTLAWERVFGPVNEGGFRSKAMDRGHEMEPRARDFFAFVRDVVVSEVGLVEHADHANVVWSPDGVYDENRRAIEAKAPLHLAWMETKRTRKVPSEYRWQCKWAIWTGQLDGLEFVAFHPDAGTLIVPVELNDADRAAMEERVVLLEAKVAVWFDILTRDNLSQSQQPKDEGKWREESTRSF